MIMLVMLQLTIFLGIWLASGQFTYVKKYAYDSLIKRTENRKDYVELELQYKTPIIIDTAKKINSSIEELLEEENLDIDQLSKDKYLQQRILENSSENILMLINNNLVNDAFIILDTGDLYDFDDTLIRPGLYFRNYDPNNNTTFDNKNVLLQFGSSKLSKKLNISLDSEWASKFEFKSDDKNYDFYTTTIENAKQYPNENLADLGYWSKISSLTELSTPSLKYTVPLINSNGDVYGVIGVGITKNTLLKKLPSYDLISEKACYILAHSENQNEDFSTVVYSGSIYKRLVDSNTKMNYSNEIDTDIYNFNADKNSEISAIANIQEISLYNKTSIYSNQSWALISIADKKTTLKVYTHLVEFFIIASVISMFMSVIITLIISRKLSHPIISIVTTLKKQPYNNNIIKFEPTGINEIDLLADSITDLQVNVKEYSSKASQIISITDIGFGLFKCDHASSDTVFVSQSLIKLLHFQDLPDEGINIPFNKFELYISKIDSRISDEISTFKNNMNTNVDYYSNNIVKTFKVNNNTDPQWLKLSIIQDNRNLIGIIQDVTGTVLEKRMIEYERDYDITTRLLNRRAYYQKLQEMFEHPEMLKTAAFIMWDLDNLKFVNDTYGHHYGDEYIKSASNVLKMFENYGGIVARLSGDEFNVFLSGFDSKEDILAILRKVEAELHQCRCIITNGKSYPVRASAGIAFYPDDGTTYETLIKNSDRAMYTIKHSTKGTFAIFDDSMESNHLE